MTSWLQDLRFALRRLAAAPGLHRRRPRDARARHRVERRDLQRRRRGAPPAAALSRGRAARHARRPHAGRRPRPTTSATPPTKTFATGAGAFESRWPPCAPGTRRCRRTAVAERIPAMRVTSDFFPMLGARAGARPRLPAGRGPSRHVARRPALRRPVAPELRRRPVGRRPRGPAERHGLPDRRRDAPRLSRARLGALLHPGRALGARRLRPEPAPTPAATVST